MNWHWDNMSDIEEKVFNDILKLIKDNLQLLIQNHDLCLTYLIDYCNKLDIADLPLDQMVLTKFTEDALYALLNAKFLYDFREEVE